MRILPLDLTCVLGGIILYPALLSAGGFESAGLGARATSMGGAFIGVADDWTAIYWNPAGLAHLKGAGVGTSLEYVRVITHDSQGLVNGQIPFTQANIERGDVFSQFGGEPSQFNGQDSDFREPLPSLGFYWNHGGTTLAAGSYTPLGFAFDVGDGKEPGFDASYKSEGFIVNHNLSISQILFPGLSVGAGVNLVEAELDRFSDKKAPDYESSASAKSDALGVQGVFGFMADLGTRVHVGGVYRTGEDLNMKGHASLVDSRFPVEESDFTQDVLDPTTYGVGVSVLPWSTMTLAADWQRTVWSAWQQNVSFDQPGLVLQNQQIDPGWASTNRYRFGAEWRPCSAWSFRGGFFRDPRAVSFASQGLTGLIDPDAHYFTSGLSYHHPHWQLSVTNVYGGGKEVVDGRTLKKEVNSFITEFDYFWL